MHRSLSCTTIFRMKNKNVISQSYFNHAYIEDE
jgi:hypothetical protein